MVLNIDKDYHGGWCEVYILPFMYKKAYSCNSIYYFLFSNSTTNFEEQNWLNISAMIQPLKSWGGGFPPATPPPINNAFCAVLRCVFYTILEIYI